MPKVYDVVIIGSGLGGLTAGLYCCRAKFKTLILEKENLGGSIIDAALIENWPGIEEGISGAELAGNALMQVTQYDVDLVSSVDAQAIELVENDLKKVRTSEETYLAKAVIISGGTRPKKLNIPGEEHFVNRGISTCVMCDGANFLDKDIAILGGGDTGVSGALYMGRLGCKITLIEAKPQLTASKVLQEKVREIPGIRVLCSAVAEKIEFEEDTKNLRLKNLETQEQISVRVEGVFVLVGRDPETEYLRDIVALDDAGFVKVTHAMETNVPGIFAAGDIRAGSAMQAITAAGDGATAAIAAERYINAGAG